MIEIVDLHKSFGTKQVLDGVNLSIHKGETLVIIGRSGEGKSVLIKHIVGLLQPDSGYVSVEGEIVSELEEKQLYELRKKFGISPKTFIVGFVFRNQLRKSVPNLLQGFRL